MLPASLKALAMPCLHDLTSRDCKQSSHKIDAKQICLHEPPSLLRISVRLRSSTHGLKCLQSACTGQLQAALQRQGLQKLACRMLSSATEATTQSSAGFHAKSDTFEVWPPCTKSSSGGPSSASSAVCRCTCNISPSLASEYPAGIEVVVRKTRQSACKD